MLNSEKVARESGPMISFNKNDFLLSFFVSKLNCKNILFHRDVADGMRYLQSKDVVHR